MNIDISILVAAGLATVLFICAIVLIVIGIQQVTYRGISNIEHNIQKGSINRLSGKYKGLSCFCFALALILAGLSPIFSRLDIKFFLLLGAVLCVIVAGFFILRSQKY